MLGMFVGLASLVGLVYVIQHRHGTGFAHRRWSRSGAAWLSRRLFDRLDTSPGQEKVIRDAVEDLFERLRRHRAVLRRSRTELAAAVSGESLDEARLGDVFAQHDDVIAGVRTEFVGAIGRVHEVLDARQRRQLARLIEHWSVRHHHPRGPYREGADEEAV